MAMGDKTGIEWTDATWNPIRGWRMTSAGPRWTGNVELVEDHLHDPVRWKKPRNRILREFDE